MDGRGFSITRIGSALVAVLLFGACGGSQPAATTGTPREPASTGAPSPIDGLFFSGDSVLKVEGGTWTLQAQTLRLEGVIEVSEGRLALSKERSCPDRGTYSWALSDEGLTIQSVDDPCPGRHIVMSGSWEPIEPVGTAAKAGEYVVLPDLHFAVYRGELDVSEVASAEIEVIIREGEGWFFSPTVLTGAPGQQLELTIRNPKGAGIVPLGHNFSLPDQDIDVDIEFADQATVTIEFPESGSLTFLCKYHADHGQAGALIVS